LCEPHTWLRWTIIESKVQLDDAGTDCQRFRTAASYSRQDTSQSNTNTCKRTESNRVRKRERDRGRKTGRQTNRQYLLSDPSCWYSDTSVLDVDSVGAFDSWHILDADSTIVTVNDSCHYLTGRRNIDHVTCDTSGSGMSRVQYDGTLFTN